MRYIVKIGKYYLREFYTNEDKPSLKFISQFQFTCDIDKAFKFKEQLEADYMIDILCDNLEIYEDKSSLTIEEIEEENE